MNFECVTVGTSSNILYSKYMIHYSIYLWYRIHKYYVVQYYSMHMIFDRT